VQHLVTTLAAVSVLAASLVAGTPSVASAAGCSATNTGTGVRFGSLQSAVTAAAPGDTLRIGGTCIGNVTIAKRLTLVGIGTGPTVRGNGGRPLTIVGGPVTIDRLRITDGVATSCGGAAIQRDASGGGILASVKVTIKRSVVDGNLVSAAGDASGGGIAMTNEATLRVSDSTIRDNVLTADAVAGDARGVASSPTARSRSPVRASTAMSRAASMRSAAVSRVMQR